MICLKNDNLGLQITNWNFTEFSLVIWRRLIHFVCAQNLENVSIFGVSIFGVPIFDCIFPFFGPEIDIFKILRPFSKKECFWRNKVIKTFTGFFNLLEPSQNHMDIMWQWHLSMSFWREIPFSPPKMTIRFSPPKPYRNLHQNP